MTEKYEPPSPDTENTETTAEPSGAETDGAETAPPPDTAPAREAETLPDDGAVAPESAKESAVPEDAAPHNPPTGDAIYLFFSLALISFITALVTIWFRFKKRK